MREIPFENVAGGIFLARKDVLRIHEIRSNCSGRFPNPKHLKRVLIEIHVVWLTVARLSAGITFQQEI
jgi:hypothetical protein